MSDYSWIGPLISAVGKGINSGVANNTASDQYRDAYAAMLANLQQRFGDYDALGKAGYSDIEAQQLGDSALGGIQNDPQARLAQQEAMVALSDLAANGGLSLADMQALNEIQRNLNQNNTARQKGLANDFAARGQLGAGAQLAMSLQGQQQAAESANQRGESVAAQAQQRALQAILQKGQMGRAMGNDDYGRKRDAAMARDAIEARNAAARTDASKYNNTLRGQAFDDEISKVHGKTALTDSSNRILFGRGQTNANQTLTNANLVNTGIGAGGNMLSSLLKDDDPDSTSGNTTVDDEPTWEEDSEEIEGGDD
jgi:hypothetical protein